MQWLSNPDARPSALPAVWLISTDARQQGLDERSRLRRGLGRTIAARWLGLDEREVAIGHDPAGQPFIEAPGASRLRLSLATRSGVVAVALAERAVGVDVETVDADTAPPLALLHPDERRALALAAERERPVAFARLWAAKEAYVKALGTGFSRPPESFAVTLEDPIHVAIRDPQRPAPVRGETLLTTNGGQVSLAAAVVVLG